MYPNPGLGSHNHGNAKQPLNPQFVHSHNGIPCFGHGQPPQSPESACMCIMES